MGVSRLLSIILISLFFIYHGCKSKDEQEQQDSSTDTSEIVGDLLYTIPDGWIKEKPRSSMRKAQYRLPGDEDIGDAEMAVFVFPGSGGGVQANINRWVGQFKQPDGSDSMIRTKINQIESHGLPVTLVYVTGTYSAGAMGGSNSELTDYAMMAAIVETSSDPWFFKTTGPEETINKWYEKFEKFATTIRQE